MADLFDTPATAEPPHQKPAPLLARQRALKLALAAGERSELFEKLEQLGSRVGEPGFRERVANEVLWHRDVGKSARDVG